MRRLIYQVCVGGEVNPLWNHCTQSVRDYADRIGADYYKQNHPHLRIQPDPKTSGRSAGASRLGYLPIFEKENAFLFLGVYDQVAIIDADVWVNPNAPDVFDELQPQDDFAGVVERDMPLTAAYRDKIRSYSRGQYQSLDDVDWRWNEDGAEFMNMGVMVMNAKIARFLRDQTPAEFLARPEFKPLVDGVGPWKWATDQTLLNWWLCREKANMRHLDWRWNCLYSAVESWAPEEAHFVHFFLQDHLPDRGAGVPKITEAWR